MRAVLAAPLLILLALFSPTPGETSPIFLRKWPTADQLADLAIHPSGEVYGVGENVTVQRFTSEGVLLGSWSNGPTTILPSIDVGPDSRLYVTVQDRIEVLERDGTFVFAFYAVCELGCENGHAYPQAVAVDADGFIYVCNRNHDRNEGVHKYSPIGTHLGSFGVGQINNVQGLATEGSSFLYLADTRDHHIEKWTTSGVFVTAWGIDGRGPGQFDSPTDIAYDPRGFVYVADGNNNRIQQFTTDGIFVDQWGSRGTADGKFDVPHGIEVGPDGLIYVADYYNARIQVFGDQSVPAEATTWGRLKSWYRQ